jgi:hypothetical protein
MLRQKNAALRYFYTTRTDLTENKEETIKNCPTDSMVADYMTKPLANAQFKSQGRLS